MRKIILFLTTTLELEETETPDSMLEIPPADIEASPMQAEAAYAAEHVSFSARKSGTHPLQWSGEA